MDTGPHLYLQAVLGMVTWEQQYFRHHTTTQKGRGGFFRIWESHQPCGGCGRPTAPSCSSPHVLERLPDAIGTHFRFFDKKVLLSPLYVLRYCELCEISPHPVIWKWMCQSGRRGMWTIRNNSCLPSKLWVRELYCKLSIKHSCSFAKSVASMYCCLCCLEYTFFICRASLLTLDWSLPISALLFQTRRHQHNCVSLLLLILSFRAHYWHVMSVSRFLTATEKFLDLAHSAQGRMSLLLLPGQGNYFRLPGAASS